MAAFWKRNQQRLAPWLFLAPGIAMFALAARNLEADSARTKNASSAGD